MRSVIPAEADRPDEIERLKFPFERSIVKARLLRRDEIWLIM